jgi:hypothetical protein
VGTFHQNLLAMMNSAEVTGGKPIAVFLQSISGVSAINLLVAISDIHGGKREVLFFYFAPDTTRDTRRGSTDISDILPRRPRFTKMTLYIPVTLLFCPGHHTRQNLMCINV